MEISRWFVIFFLSSRPSSRKTLIDDALLSACDTCFPTVYSPPPQQRRQHHLVSCSHLHSNDSSKAYYRCTESGVGRRHFKLENVRVERVEYTRQNGFSPEFLSARGEFYGIRTLSSIQCIKDYCSLTSTGMSLFFFFFFGQIRFNDSGLKYLF